MCQFKVSYTSCFAQRRVVLSVPLQCFAMPVYTEQPDQKMVNVKKNLSMNKVHTEINGSVKNTPKFWNGIIFSLSHSLWIISISKIDIDFRKDIVVIEVHFTKQCKCIERKPRFHCCFALWNQRCAFNIYCLLRSIRLAISFFRSFYFNLAAYSVCEFINRNDVTSSHS